MRSLSTARAASVSVVVCVLGAGCGAPEPGVVHTLDENAVPYALLSPAAEATPGSESRAPGLATPSIYLLNPDEQLVPRQVPVAATTPSEVVRELLAQLERGPTDAAREQGLASPLGPGLGLRLVELAEGTARVEISVALQAPSAERLPLIVGQLVLSLSSVDGVDAVVLLRDGDVVEAPLPGGARTTDPVTAADYASLVGTSGDGGAATTSTP